MHARLVFHLRVDLVAFDQNDRFLEPADARLRSFENFKTASAVFSA